ncbi:MAG: transposase [Gammaproteobacteria bacterium]|nr:transposase [Gammaproteobacteria bacterium]
MAEFQSRFAADDNCRCYLVDCRWPDGYQCPRCG